MNEFYDGSSHNSLGEQIRAAFTEHGQRQTHAKSQIADRLAELAETHAILRWKNDGTTFASQPPHRARHRLSRGRNAGRVRACSTASILPTGAIPTAPAAMTTTITSPASSATGWWISTSASPANNRTNRPTDRFSDRRPLADPVWAVRRVPEASRSSRDLTAVFRVVSQAS